MTRSSCCRGYGHRDLAFWGSQVPAGKGELRHRPMLQTGKKPVESMVLSSSRDNAAARAARVEKGALRMVVWVRLARSLCFALFLLGGAACCTAVGSLAAASSAAAQTATTIVVEGNRRVEASTIRSYFFTNPGERLDSFKIDQALKALYATGLFQDVRINQSGGRLVVSVVENP